MAEFSAHQISSRGLKYALSPSAIGTEEFDEATYQTALLNVLNAQDFDSIPLVDCYKGPITSIGRRRLHDGDVEDVFILTPNEVSTMPRTSPVIRCIFEVLSNEHHIVFLTDEKNVIQDVVTIGMLTNPIIKDYLTLLIGRLYSEGWGFNESYLDLDKKLDYGFPVLISEELEKLDSMVGNPEKKTPTDLEVSKQIVHILSLLQPLKTWDEGPKSKAINSIDYPLKISTPEYKPGTAGYFAQHPFGAVMENTEDEGVQNLAFRLFAEANNWDHLVLKTSSGDYSHLLEKDQLMLEMEEPVAEDTELEELVHLFDEQNRPLQVNYKHSPYPGIITLQDVVFSEHTKTKMMSSFVEFERHTRDTYMHYLGESVNDITLSYWLKLDDVQKGPVWREGLKDAYQALWEILPDEMRLLEPSIMEHDVIGLRNSMAHADFQLTPEEEIEPKKVDKYLSYLKFYYSKIQNLVILCERVNRGTYFNEFAHLFHSEYESLLNPTNSKTVRRRLAYQLRQDFLNLKFTDGVFVLMLANRSVEPAKKIKSILQERKSIWQFEIADDAESHQARIQADKNNKIMERKRKAKKAAKKKIEEAAKKEAISTAKKKAEAAAQIKARKELIPILTAKITELLNSECKRGKNVIRKEDFIEKCKAINRRTRDDLKITNQIAADICEIEKRSFKDGGIRILDSLGIHYEEIEMQDDEGEKAIHYRIINLNPTEEE